MLRVLGGFLFALLLVLVARYGEPFRPLYQLNLIVVVFVYLADCLCLLRRRSLRVLDFLDFGFSLFLNLLLLELDDFVVVGYLDSVDIFLGLALRLRRFYRFAFAHLEYVYLLLEELLVPVERHFRDLHRLFLNGNARILSRRLDRADVSSNPFGSLA